MVRTGEVMMFLLNYDRTLMLPKRDKALLLAHVSS